MGVPTQQFEQVVVTPSQVTCPGSLIAQLKSTAVQLTDPEQLTIAPEKQYAVALQADLFRGLGAKGTPFCRAPQETPAAGSPRIAARAAPVRGGWLGVCAKPAIETKRKEPASIQAFFISISSSVGETAMRSQ